VRHVIAGADPVTVSAVPRQQFGLMPSWEIVPAAATPIVGATLRLSQRALPLGEIRGVIMTSDSRREIRPALAVLAAFGSIGLVLVIGVLGLEWRTRMLVGALLFVAIGLSALNDIVWLTRASLHRVEILTARGETLVYATTDESDARRLAACLTSTLAANRTRMAQLEPQAHCDTRT
jgi:hypothetical protein